MSGRRVDFTPGGKAVTHGGFGTAYVSYGCRCDECRAANAARQKRFNAKRKAGRTPEHVHGTYGGYVNYGCRCERCFLVHAEAMRAQRQSREARVQDAPHGTHAAYNGWGCRCDDCKAAAAARRAREARA